MVCPIHHFLLRAPRHQIVSCDAGKDDGEDGREGREEGDEKDADEDRGCALILDGLLAELHDGVQNEDADTGTDAGEGVNDIGILFELGEKERDHRNDDHGRGDDAERREDAAPEAFQLAADEGRDIHCDHAGRDLPQGIVIHQLFLAAPVLILYDLTLENGQHRVSAAKGDSAHLGKDEK